MFGLVVSFGRKRILTRDEKWIYLYYAGPLCRVRQRRNSCERSCYVFAWTFAGVVRYEFSEVGKTIAVGVYRNQLERVREELQKRQPTSVNRKEVLFLRDNVRPRGAKTTRAEIMELGWKVMSLDLSPTDPSFLGMYNRTRGKRDREMTAKDGSVQVFLYATRIICNSSVRKLLNRRKKIARHER